MKSMVLFEAGLLLIVITAFHDGTSQRTEGRATYRVEDALEAIHKCAIHQQSEIKAVKKFGHARGRVTVTCKLRHEDGTETELMPTIEIVP